VTTILSAGSDRKPLRCDARCHNAKAPECDCICGGRYHGALRNGGREELNRRIDQYMDPLLENFGVPVQSKLPESKMLL
jgi:hypothetical protein